MRAYLAWMLGVSLLAIGGIAAMNYQVDPYLTHQWDSAAVQRLRPPRERLSVWSKTYALARFHPSVVYLGNSRTEVGLPATTGLVGGQSVFNGALSGASVGDAMAMARHVLQLGRPSVIVWGLDAPSFSLVVGTHDFDRELVADGNLYLLRRGLINLRRAVSVDMTRDSIRLLHGTFGAVCQSSLALYGQHDERCLASRIGGWGGTGTVIAPRIAEYVRGGGPERDAMRQFVATLGQMCRQHIQVRLYINPTHASTQDALAWSGKWDAMLDWQRSLTASVAMQRLGGCDVRLFDFSGFNSVTEESIPQVSGRPEMQYYWEPSHYRSLVGAMILHRIFGGGEAPADFGRELTPAMLDGHHAAMLKARAAYREHHPFESALARRLAQAQLKQGG